MEGGLQTLMILGFMFLATLSNVKKVKPKQAAGNKISISTSVYIRLAYQDLKLRGKKLQDHLIQKGFPLYPLRTLRRHGKKPVFDERPDGRRNNKGRPRKIDERTSRRILLSLNKLRDADDMFCSVQVQEAAGVDSSVCSNRTVRRLLNQNEYFYLQSRKKGLLEPHDLKRRLEFARINVKRPLSFWQTGIAFYLDGVGWGHKTNPSDHARTLRTRTWRKKKEGCVRGCTAKGKKEGVGGRMVHFMVAIAWGKGIVKAIPYDGPINGAKFAEIVRKNFPALRMGSSNPTGIWFLQDGDKSQNSKESVSAIHKIGLQVFHIPARSPDLNPIENIFHLISKKIRADGKALNLKKETYEEFRDRCYQTMMNYPTAIIDKTIESMPKRLRGVLDSNGNRTKY